MHYFGDNFDFIRLYLTVIIYKISIEQALLGHSQVGMDAHYIKPSEEDFQQAMGRYTSWFDGKVAESSDQSSDQSI
jgi:hypothetical protein